MVAGAGALGLSAVLAAVVTGAGTIIAVDRHESRLEPARHTSEGRFPDELITTLPLERRNEAEAASASGEVVEPVLVFPT